MGEYYIVANSDKRQYLNGNSLGMSVTLPGVMASPLSQILIWLLAEGTPISGGIGLRGTWAGDRIVVAGDEGSLTDLVERTHAEFQDITVEAFEDMAAHCSDSYIRYCEEGLLDNDGRFIPEWSSRGRTLD